MFLENYDEYRVLWGSLEKDGGHGRLPGGGRLGSELLAVKKRKEGCLRQCGGREGASWFEECAVQAS